MIQFFCCCLDTGGILIKDRMLRTMLITDCRVMEKRCRKYEFGQQGGLYKTGCSILAKYEMIALAACNRGVTKSLIRKKREARQEK